MSMATGSPGSTEVRLQQRGAKPLQPGKTDVVDIAIAGEDIGEPGLQRIVESELQLLIAGARLRACVGRGIADRAKTRRTAAAVVVTCRQRPDTKSAASAIDQEQDEGCKKQPAREIEGGSGDQVAHRNARGHRTHERQAFALMNQIDGAFAAAAAIEPGGMFGRRGQPVDLTPQ